MCCIQLQEELSQWTEKEYEKGLFTHNVKVITRSWIRDGLKPRCISRDLKWGTPVPLEGYTDKVRNRCLRNFALRFAVMVNHMHQLERVLVVSGGYIY